MKTYTTFAGWKRACKKVFTDRQQDFALRYQLVFDGNGEICFAWMSPDGKVTDKCNGIGEWDGEKGEIY